YRILATLLAYLIATNSERVAFSQEEIVKLADVWSISRITQLPRRKLEALLLEMCDLNILQEIKIPSLASQYAFARYSFRQMLGSLGNLEDQILNFSDLYSQ
ncbi:MAG: hypothetical protein K2H85_02055, partial [Allobaculum sp.]|nr:hypothetical protein [Allobaculum sp.]